MPGPAELGSQKGVQKQEFSTSSATNQRFSQSSIPCFGLSALFFASAFFPPALHAKTFTPPFVLRVGFGTVFAGAGYVLASGDSRNGSGIATAWSLSYFLIEQFTLGLEKTARLPRSRLAIALSGATAATAALYGTEHFLQDGEDPDFN
ncbi:hypothetical protein BC834DRAFT_198761 [Gloeopeniophorella convolvens]|nr:hypothetical protein BC834DRAFT_198761 [Gloeopeniophorella convolvens]